jgi:hypothetical protein
MAVEKSTDEGTKEDVPFADEKDGTVGEAKSFPEGMPKEYLEVLKDLQEQVADLKSNQAAVSEALIEEGYENPVDDYLEEPAVFFAFSSRYGIYGDKRYNKEVLPPRGEAIRFEKLYRYKKSSGSGARGNTVISVSQAVVRSKATAEWLREHSLFGIKVFEDAGKAQNVNVTLAEKMAEMNAVVTTMSDHDVIQRATREDVPISSGDIGLLRKQLVRKLAEGALKNEKNIREIKLREGEFDENGRKVEQGKVGDVDADLKTTSVY